MRRRRRRRRRGRRRRAAHEIGAAHEQAGEAEEDGEGLHQPARGGVCGGGLRGGRGALEARARVVGARGGGRAAVERLRQVSK